MSYSYSGMYDDGIKTWQWITTIIVIVVLIAVGVTVFGKNQNQEKSESDKEYCTRIGRDKMVSELPAICLQYFK